MIRMAIVALFILWSCVACIAMPPEPPVNRPPEELYRSDTVVVTRLQTGWVAVKRRFREARGPDWWQLPAIILDRTWTEWMPISAFLVEHAQGKLLFDTGETARVADDRYFSCDRATGWFYQHQLRFAVAVSDEIGPQLSSMGIEPDSIDHTVLSHLHSDHIGGLAHVVSARWYLSARDADGHAGALLCRIPEHADTVKVLFEDGPHGAFEQSHAVSDDNRIRIVPTPGHTPGHQSLLIEDGDHWILIAGDAVFDRRRLNEGRALAGIVEDPAAARSSISVIERQLADFNTSLFAAHDPEP